MSTLGKTFSYSIGRKLIMSLTGLFLVTFLIAHLAGNLLLFAGPATFNQYAEFMGSNIFIRVVEIGMFLGFIIHIVDGIAVSLYNNKARPQKYAVSSGNANSSWFSRNMKSTGIIILIFLILHLISFYLTGRFGVDVAFGISDAFSYTQPGMENISHEEISLWHKTAAQFSVEWYSIIYVLSMVLLAFHLNHGFQSAFQTLGLNHKKYTPIIKGTGLLFSIVVPLGFAAMPIYFLILKYTGNLLPYFQGPTFGL